MHLPLISGIIYLHAGVVQRLVCDLAKVEMAVRFRSLAPKAKIVEIDVLIESQLILRFFCVYKKGVDFNDK